MTAREDEPAPLAEGARRFVDAARPFERLPPERKARVRGRVLAAIAAGAAVSAVAAEATAASAEGAGAAGSALEAAAGPSAGPTLGVAGLGAGATKAAGLSLFTKIGLAVALVTVGTGGFLWSQAQSVTAPPASPAPTESAASVAAVSSSAPAPQNAPPDPSAAPESPAAPASNAASALPAAPGPRASTAPAGAEKPGTDPGAAAADSAPQADTLSEENKLLAAAHAALARGDAAGALALLDEHAARFPRGALAPERRAARAMALCKQGRSADGRREADALYGADSKSPLAEKIRRACDR